MAPAPRQRLYSFESSCISKFSLTTEYERFLAAMVSEKKAKLAELTGKKGKEKELEALASDIRFLEVELQRYQQGMTLFRSRNPPRVGRWGKPESEGRKEEP